MSARPMDLVGVLFPGPATIAQPKTGDPSLLHSIVPGAVGGVAGVALWPKHRVLGFLAGESLGMNAYRFYRNQGADRTKALSNLGMTAAAVVGALLWKKHPIIGYFAGMFAGAAASSFVPGSNAAELRKKL